MDGKETTSTNWSTENIPNQGKNHSRADDNFKACFSGQTATLMRCVSGTVVIKGIPMVNEAKVKLFQSIFERTKT
jgi:hypothetical protein